MTVCAITLLVTVLSGALATTAQAAAYPNDPYYARQWHLRRIGAPAAWKVTKGKGVTIAIVDTGVNRTHEDLASRMSPMQYNANDPSKDARDSCPPDPRIRNRRVCHGTSVAGAAVAGTNNGRGIAGVAPDARIMAVQVFQPRGGATPGDVADGVMWAVDHGANVINLSLGGSLPVDPSSAIYGPALLAALASGALVVVAAGNEAAPWCADPAFTPTVLCVGASDSMDALADFGGGFGSNYGLRLDVVAPGKGVWTTCTLPGQPVSSYCPQQGTSVAAPVVAGLGALLMSMGASSFQAASIIRSTAKDLGLPGYDLSYGFGRVSASAAVDLCKQVCGGGAR